MKKVRSSLIENFLLQLHAGNIIATGANGAAALRETRAAFREILQGGSMDDELRIERSRGTPVRADLSRALKVQAWRDEGNSWDEIADLAEEHGMCRSLERLRKLPREYAAEIKHFHELVRQLSPLLQ